MSPPLSLSDIFTAAADKLGKSGGWCQGALARAADGAECSPWSSEAVCWCLTGSVASFGDHKLAKDALEFLGGKTRSLHTWNDRQPSARQVVKRLRTAARAALAMGR